MSEITIRLPKPHPTQQKILSKASRFNAIAMGEKGGKTTLGVEVLIASERGALSGKNPVAWFAASAEELLDVRRQIKSAIDPLIKRQVNSRRIELANGNFIDTYSFDELPVQFPQYGLIVIDDVCRMPRFIAKLEDVLSETIREFQGQAWFLSQAFGKQNDFFRLWDKGQFDPDWSCWQFPSVCNPSLPSETRQQIEQADEHERLQRFEAHFFDVGIKLTKDQKLIGKDESFRQWCERLAKDGLKVDGKPFSLNNRQALIPLYDAIPTHKEDAKDLVLIIQKATQLGLSIWETLASIYMAIKWEPVSIGMFMPAQASAIHKSEHRFMRIVRSAPVLYDFLTTGHGVNGDEKKVGEGNVLTRKVRESLLLFLWTSGKVTTESVPLDVVTMDETQEMTLEQIDKVRARTGDSDIQFTMLLSTANNPDLDINFWYQQGTQEVWHTECHHCGEHSDLSDPAGNFPDKSIGYNNGDVHGVEKGEYYWKCPACGGVLTDPQVGRYIVTNPSAPATMRSFLLPRTISPKLTPRKMIEAWGRAKTGDQKKSFYNRTLARPYIDADQLPVTMAHCLAAANAGMELGLKWKKSGKNTFAGIDQMGSFNAIIIKERLPDGRQAVVHVEAVFDHDPFERCAELMDVFGVSICVLEQLPNVNDARRFANRFPGRVFLAGYADLRDDAMSWGDDMSKSDRRTNEEERSRYTVTLNQYKCMQTSLFRIRGTMIDGKLVPMCLFPNPDELVQDVIENGRTKRIPILRDWVFYHFTKTALVVEQDEEQRKPRAKVHKVGIDPHYSYANMLCDIAWARANGTTTFFIPDAGRGQQQALSPQDIAVPEPLVAMIAEAREKQLTGDVCGRCTSRNPDTGICSENGARTRESDPGCWAFISVA